MTAGATVHNFQERLAFSEKASDEPFWEQIYRKAFPRMVNLMLGSGDTDSQRMGIDRVILLSNGKMLTVDEKKREKTWGDILLEYVSVDTTGAPGWIEKDLAIDFLAYAFMDTRRVYLFSWLLLRMAWQRHKEQWLEKARSEQDGFRIVPAQNKGYVTKSVAVPIRVLQEAVQVAAVISLDNTVQQPELETPTPPATGAARVTLTARRESLCAICGNMIRAGDSIIQNPPGVRHWDHADCVHALSIQETQPGF